MPICELGGSVGSFRDNNQEVEFRVWGKCEYQTAPGVDPASLEDWLRGKVLNAVKSVIGAKLAANQIAVPTMIQSLPALIGEVIAATGAQEFGAQITKLDLNMMRVQPESAAQGQPPQALPPNPWQATANAYEKKAKEKLDPRNYDVHARVNVGGFKVNMSSDGGLDTTGLKSQLKDKVKTEIIWYAGGCVVLLIVGVGLLGLGWYIYRNFQASTSSGAAGDTSGGGAAKAATWDGKSTFTCGGNDHVKLVGVTAKLTSGAAIEAGGSCHLELVNCQISAPTGIDAAGAAVVTVTGGSIDATTLAVHAIGLAEVHLQGTKVKGKTQGLGGAKITGP